jgi:hypothetical protein
MGRTAFLVLVGADGEVLGSLPPVELDLPYWQESADLVAAVKAEFGIDIVVLRVLGAKTGKPPGGMVLYLAQTDQRPQNLKRAMLDKTPQPLRMPYAEVNGPHRTLAWAAERIGPLRAADQQRTWNLSSIWRLETDTETVWLKEVPPFFAHEADVIRWAAGHGGRVPHVIAADGGRMLLRDIPGRDLYGAPLPVREAIARDHHHIQLASRSALGELAALGVPDRRGARLVDWMQAVLPPNPVVRRVPELLDQAYGCGLPDALVHGDLHPGNARGDAEHRTLLDWGDCFLGHPAFDVLRLTDGLDEADSRSVMEQWAGRWREAYPGSDPVRAAELLGPVAALRFAAVYAEFLANIEPAEHPYHADDVPFWIGRAEQGLRQLDGVR